MHAGRCPREEDKQSTLPPCTSSRFKMGNLELEQDPKSVNIKPVKQEKGEMVDG